MSGDIIRFQINFAIHKTHIKRIKILFYVGLRIYIFFLKMKVRGIRTDILHLLSVHCTP